MERALLDRPANYDHDFDGRPPVAWHGDDDPLLDALIRAHPERATDGQISTRDQLQALRGVAAVGQTPRLDHPAQQEAQGHAAQID